MSDIVEYTCNACGECNVPCKLTVEEDAGACLPHRCPYNPLKSEAAWVKSHWVKNPENVIKPPSERHENVITEADLENTRIAGWKVGDEAWQVHRWTDGVPEVICTVIGEIHILHNGDKFTVNLATPQDSYLSLDEVGHTKEEAELKALEKRLKDLTDQGVKVAAKIAELERIDAKHSGK